MRKNAGVVFLILLVVAIGWVGKQYISQTDTGVSTVEVIPMTSVDVRTEPEVTKAASQIPVSAAKAAQNIRNVESFEDFLKQHPNYKLDLTDSEYSQEDVALYRESYTESQLTEMSLAGDINATGTLIEIYFDGSAFNPEKSQMAWTVINRGVLQGSVNAISRASGFLGFNKFVEEIKVQEGAPTPLSEAKELTIKSLAYDEMKGLLTGEDPQYSISAQWLADHYGEKGILTPEDYNNAENLALKLIKQYNEKRIELGYEKLEIKAR